MPRVLLFVVLTLVCYSLAYKRVVLQRSISRASKENLHNKFGNLDDLSVTLNVPTLMHDLASNGINMQSLLSRSSAVLSNAIHSMVKEKNIIVGLGSMLLAIYAGVQHLLLPKLQTQSDSPPDDIYNATKLSQYYSKRGSQVILRILEMVLLSVKFNAWLLLDLFTGRLQKNEKFRALDIAELLARLGPTYVKIGQALSIRTDIVSPAYADGLKTLQDSVAPFETELAHRIICKELNITALSKQFKTFSPAPVASASIGQVYKATLLDGREVAVKVQRPSVQASILLDLHVLRTLTPVQVHMANAIAGMPTNSADIEMAYSLVDEWGRGLVAELDYLQEARNTKAFSKAMRHRGLLGIMAPEVVDSLCTRKVLVTEWIEGTRLDRDNSQDVPRLCGTAVNAYLTMLLDTGTLHCDPHPGNLLRTKDGRLCILDWGMTLTVPQDLQYSLLEFIAHCNAQDFSQLAEDFVKLGATPIDKIDQVRQSGIPEGFAFIMKQLHAGGGPAQLTNRLRTEFKARYGDMSDAELSLKCREGMIHSELHDPGQVGGGSNVAGVTGVLEMMSKRNRDIFKLPSYMLYVARAFATLEGIGLSTDPNYSILRECYPYLAKRLLTDNTPRCRQVLREMLYHDGKLSAAKLVEFSDGFRSYTASTAKSSTQDTDQYRATQALTDLILDADNSLVQELLSDGVAMYGDSLLREGLSIAKHSTAGRLVRAVLRTPKTIVDMVVPDDLKVLALPLTLPYDVAKAVGNLLDTTAEDAQNVQSARDLLEHLRPSNITTTTTSTAPRKGRGTSDTQVLVSPGLNNPRSGRFFPLRNAGSILKRRVPGVVHLTRRMLASILTRTAHRLEATDDAALPVARRGQRTSHHDINSEVEMLVTEGIGSLASTAAKTVAQVLV